MLRDTGPKLNPFLCFSVAGQECLVYFVDPKAKPVMIRVINGSPTK